MDNLTEKRDFLPFKASLKEASHDDANSVYMLADEIEVIRIDDVTDDYTSKCRISSVDSVDALHYCDSEGNALVEFKNGKLDNKDIYEIMQKVYNSLLIISDITKLTIGDFRKELDFVLVYNKEKNPSFFNEIPAPSNSNALRTMTKTMSKKAKKEFNIEGLYAFESFCVRTVKIMSVEQFKGEYLNYS